MTSLLTEYLRDVSRLPLLTNEAVIDLARARDAGDAAAVGRIVTGNLRLVVSVAKQFRLDLWRIADLVSAGNVGLIRAAEKFDPTLGVKFSTYATYWIKQAVYYYVQGDTPIRTPAYLRLRSTHRLAPAAEAVRTVGRLDDEHTPEPTAREDGTPAQVEEMERAAALAEAIGRLPEREAAVLRLRLESGRKGKPMTLEEVGQVVGVTKERVRQIERAARQRLEQDEGLRAAVGA